MKIKLCTNEHIIKSWDYATEHVNNEHFCANLTVTDKRIISMHQNGKSIARNEVPLSSVTGINIFHGRKANFGAVLLLLVGLVFALFPVTLAMYESTIQPMLLQTLGFNIGKVIYIVISCVICIAGLIMFFGAVKILRQALFCLEILTNGNESGSVMIGNESANVFGRHSKYAVQIKVSRRIAMEILDQLGAIICENRQ